MKKLLKEYWIETVCLVVILFAVYFLMNRSQVGAARWAGQVAFWRLGLWFDKVFTAISSYIDRISATEFLAWLLILGVVFILISRIRIRYLKSDHWQVTTCPKCDSKLSRVHRTPIDRFLGAFLLPNSARYKCYNSSCGWSGLRQGRSQSSSLQSRGSTGSQS